MTITVDAFDLVAMGLKALLFLFLVGAVFVGWLLSGKEESFDEGDWE